MKPTKMPEDAVLNVQLPGRPEAAAAARTALATLNGDLHLVSPARLADAQLLVTELVANAIRAASGQPVELRVRVSQATLRVEVLNGGGHFDPSTLPAQSVERAGGWGLRIVDAIAHQWGVEPAEDSVTVWFEIGRPQAESPLPVSEQAFPPSPPSPD